MVLAAREIAEDFSRPTERIAKLRAELVAEPYSICLERPKLIGEFERSAVGRRVRRDEHSLVRRAMALDYLFSNRKPRIYPDELIVGNMTSKRVAANYYTEGGSINILEDVLRLEKKATSITLPYRERVQLVVVGLRTVFKSVGGGRFCARAASVISWTSSGPSAITSPRRRE